MVDAAKDVARKRDDERRELVTRMVPPGEVIHITVEHEDGERGRQVVTVWREPKTHDRTSQ